MHRHRHRHPYLLYPQYPQQKAHLHRRRDMRVAGPDQSPLKVQVTLGDRKLEALLVNLTETGVGLAFEEAVMVDLHAAVEIDAELPDGAILTAYGRAYRCLPTPDDQIGPPRDIVLVRWRMDG